MVHLILTLTSGVQLVIPFDHAQEAEEYVQLIRLSWADNRATMHDLPIGSDDGATDWIRLAHVSAVRIAPAHLSEEGRADAATG